MEKMTPDGEYNIDVTPKDYVELKELKEKAEKEGEDFFTFKDHTVYVGFAKYMLEAMENHYGDKIKAYEKSRRQETDPPVSGGEQVDS